MKTSNHSLSAFIFFAVLLIFGGTSASIAADPNLCAANASWVSKPAPPEEVPLGKQADFCQFYQFSWQWFLKMVSPVNASAKQTDVVNPPRFFQDLKNFPELEANDQGTPLNSCDDLRDGNRLFVRAIKPVAGDGSFSIPKRTGQAGGGDVIYDQNGNVVYYNIQFSRNLCDVGKIQSQPNYPSGTTEMKTAWKQIKASDKGNYFWMVATIDQKDVLLGLIGFHLIRATALHPEFIWATFEHKDNVPDCVAPQTAPSSGWSFTSAQCASVLAQTDTRSLINCRFNTAAPSANLTGTPNEICRLYRDASAPTDPKGELNISVIDQLNAQLVGPNGFLTKITDPSNPMAVWKNYINVGALWLSDTTQPSQNNSDHPYSNQRGSMRLANTVMETTFQAGFSASFAPQWGKDNAFSSNCFGCHGFTTSANTASPANTLPNASLSHIFDDVIAGQCKTNKVDAGPIWSNDDAQVKCPKTCANHGGWNGQWRTTQWGVMSECDCCAP